MGLRMRLRLSCMRDVQSPLLLLLLLLGWRSSLVVGGVLSGVAGPWGGGARPMGSTTSCRCCSPGVLDWGRPPLGQVQVRVRV